MRPLTLAAITCMTLCTAQAAGSPPGDGFRLEQAEDIAVRFAATIPIEGSVGRPGVLQGDDWALPFKIGYAAVANRDPILVNRHTGKASWAGLDDLNTPHERHDAHPGRR